MKRLKKITGQTACSIVTLNGTIAAFNEHGIIEVEQVSNKLYDDLRNLYEALFGGK